jgi:hypothetical protein
MTDCRSRLDSLAITIESTWICPLKMSERALAPITVSVVEGR